MRATRAILPILILGLMSAGALAVGSQERLTIAIGAEPTSLDVHNTRANSDENVAWYIYESLVSRNNAQVEVRPSLATSWEVSSDGLTWIFFLKQEVFFHDGTPFNAAAVVANFERLLNPAAPCIKSGVYSFVDRVEAIDEFTVAFKLKFPFGPTLAHIAHPGGGIASPTALEKYGTDIGQNPVGTGPFVLKSWSVGVGIVLVRNESYHGQAPAFAEIEFRTVREEAARVMMLETGDADIAIGIPPSESMRLAKDPRFQEFRTPTNRIVFIGINLKNPVFSDLRVRQALNYAVDKEAIIEEILDGYGSVSDSVLAPLTWGYVPGIRYEYDPYLARKLLREAGIPEGTKMTLKTPQGRYLRDAETAEAVQGYLIAVGLDVELEIMEWGAFITQVMQAPEEKATHYLYLMAFSPSTADADWLLRSCALCSSLPPLGYNATYFCNEEFDRLALEAQREVDPEKRLALYGEAQAIFRDAAPFIFLNVMEYVAVGRSDLGGVVASPIEYLFAWDAYVKP
ncbi:MAG: ABC transporter substrate-binding protein [Candidatus Bipolaricaulia bacterium]